MLGKVHLASGLIAGSIAAAAIQDQKQALVFAGVCTLGALLPDIDIETSIIGRCVYPVSKLIHATCGHRGFFHTPLFGILAGYLTYLLVQLKWPGDAVLAGLAMSGGVILHLILDSFTYQGVPMTLLYPIRRKGIRGLQCMPSSSPVCWLAMVPCSLVWGIAMRAVLRYSELI